MSELVAKKIQPIGKKIQISAAESLYDRYLQVGVAKGCPVDQIRNFFKGQMFLQNKQLEMAAAARICDRQDGPIYIGVGGARAGGKSQWMFAQVTLDDCQRYPGLKFLMLRKSATSLREQIRDLLLKTCRAIQYNYREQAGIIEFPNGSYVVIKHFKDEKDIDDFLGQEYDGIAIEELTTLTFDKWKNLMTCLRSSKENWRPRFYGAWNWGGLGHAWVKRIFYDPWTAGEQKDSFYIKATVADNQHVNAENKKILETLTGWRYKSWYLGDPNFQAGQFFTTWDERHHVIRAYDEKRIVRWGAGFDYGWTHPTAFVLGGWDKEGNLFVLDEYGGNKTTPDEHAAGIFGVCKRHYLTPSDLDYIAAGRDCFSKQEEGRTISDTYHDNGVDFQPAEVNRIQGWSKLTDLLGDPERKISPSIFIHERCQNLISQIPLAQHHDKRPEDIEKMNADEEGECGDDYLEALRNLISTNPNQGIKWIGVLNLSGKFQPAYAQIGN